VKHARSTTESSLRDSVQSPLSRAKCVQKCHKMPGTLPREPMTSARSCHGAGVKRMHKAGSKLEAKPRMTYIAHGRRLYRMA
jgi:hypothetical protein